MQPIGKVPGIDNRAHDHPSVQSPATNLGGYGSLIDEMDEEGRLGGCDDGSVQPQCGLQLPLVDDSVAFTLDRVSVAPPDEPQCALVSGGENSVWWE